MNRNVLKSFEIAPGVLGEPNFTQFAQTCWDGGYTGPTLVHWLHGRPQMVELEGKVLRLQTVKPKPRKERKSAIPQAPAPWNRI